MYINFNLLAELDETANQEIQGYLKLKKFKKGEYLLKKGSSMPLYFFFKKVLLKFVSRMRRRNLLCASLPKTAL